MLSSIFDLIMPLLPYLTDKKSHTWESQDSNPLSSQRPAPATNPPATVSMLSVTLWRRFCLTSAPDGALGEWQHSTSHLVTVSFLFFVFFFLLFVLFCVWSQRQPTYRWKHPTSDPGFQLRAPFAGFLLGLFIRLIVKVLRAEAAECLGQSYLLHRAEYTLGTHINIKATLWLILIEVDLYVVILYKSR